MTKPTARLRALLNAGRTVWAAGAYDALSARMIADAGFDAVMTSGFGVSASHLGLPDAELYTMTENLAVVRHACSVSAAPVIADCDTGYGNAVNVLRTVREFEQAGVAGLILEDQASPKRCPACTDQTEILPIEEAVAKIRAAVAARRDPDLVIIARTDSRDEADAIRRARAYAEAGADLVQPISRGFRSFDALERLRAGAGRRLSLQILGWLEKDLSRAQIESVAGLAVFPLTPLMSAAAALRANLAALLAAKSTQALPREVMAHDDFMHLIGFEEVERQQLAFLQAPPARAAE
ncbi:MAG: isocitrate lyase/PEP mutase family protein [Rubritepida sp.]|jgi:methylisocitrate lyase|nr:isocitrate lyase/PEP mutase family protein [Rubritepida sp.]MCU0945849.1 isocitrate lyase/PEP mutase family protein [Rubritepida sp.]